MFKKMVISLVLTFMSASVFANEVCEILPARIDQKPDTVAQLSVQCTSRETEKMLKDARLTVSVAVSGYQVIWFLATNIRKADVLKALIEDGYSIQSCSETTLLVQGARK
jgi:hypothetical protein